MFKKIFNTLDNVTPQVEAISGMDATFLYGETPTSPMHVGSVAVLEGSLEFADFKKLVHSKIHQIPRLRQRLLYVPMSIDYPYWVDDPNFNIDLHIHRVALPKPGGWENLRRMAAAIHSQALDQNRPLWEFTFVEGIDTIEQLPKGSVAIISKVHHVAIDGMAGAALMSLLFDTSSRKKEIPEPRPYRPSPLPNEIGLMFKSSLSFVENPLKLPKLFSETVVNTFKAGIAARTQKNAPKSSFTAPPTPLNRIVSPKRMWNTAILSLDRVKALKTAMGTTLNDVMLAICSSALRRYLLEKDKLPNKPLVAMVPVSQRKTVQTGETGNQIAPIFVQLATNIEDPIERLEVIHENTTRQKAYQKAIGAKGLTEMAQVVPFGIANQAARIYSRFKMAEMHNPICNVTITNVPGPPIPLYMNGHKLDNVMGMAPVVDGMGLIITILSYNGNLTVSPTSDHNTMPDINKFTRYLRESANELEAAIQARGEVKQKKKVAEKKKVEKAASEIDLVFDHFKDALKAAGDKIKPDNGLFMFHLTESDSYYRMDLNKSPGQIRKSKAANPDVTIKVKDRHLLKIAQGKLGLQAAFIQGRLKMDGDSNKAMKLATILSKLPDYKR
ncbi:MAG: wax ester/triacylglycerol synthase family O-acyltransferase [Saprospiraceae bacterium]